MSEVKRYEAVMINDGMEESSDGSFVTYSDYQKLVAENAALKGRTVKVPAKVYVKDMKSNVVRWAQVIDALSDAGIAFVRDDGELIAGNRETPATDAAIAEIKAQGVDGFVSELAGKIRLAGGEDGYSLVNYGEYADHLESRGEEFAANLRAGRKG